MAQIAKNDSDKATEAAKDATNKAAEAAKDTTVKVADTAKDVTNKTVEASKATTDRAADAARNMAERSKDATVQLVQRTASVAEEAVGRSADAARQIASMPPRAASEVFKAESGIAGLWLDLTREQVEHNLATMRKLGAVRDWREAIEIQNAYVQESLSRMAEGMNRYVEFTGNLMNRLFAVVENKAKKAA